MQKLSNIQEQYTVSEKLLFTSPFVRFWFAFISPIFKGIRDGDYQEMLTQFENRKHEFTKTIFEQLSHEHFKADFKSETLIKLGRYWDDNIQIDLLAQTKSGKIIAGMCSYSNNKTKKSELNKLKNSCQIAKINIDIFVLYSKKGYSSELKSLKSDNLKLYTIKNFNFYREKSTISA